MIVIRDTEVRCESYGENARVYSVLDCSRYDDSTFYCKQYCTVHFYHCNAADYRI